MAPWCSFRVALPHCDWPSVVATLTSLPQMDSATASAAIPLYGSSCLPLPGGISVHMVENAQDLPSALQALRDSMQVKIFFIYTVDQMLWGSLSILGDQYALKRGFKPRKCMQDALVAIDLEWRPDFGACQSRVALMQLATSSCAVLIRTCRLKHQLPPVLIQFLRCAFLAPFTPTVTHTLPCIS